MIRYVNKLLAKVFRPFSDIQKEIREMQHHNRFVMDSNKQRLAKLEATINGESAWMFKPILPNEDCNDKS